MFHPVSLTSAALAAVSLTVLVFSPSAQAASFLTGSSNGEFGAPLVDPAVDPEATFRAETTGTGSETFFLGEPGNGSMPNQLTFAGEVFDTPVTDTAFSIGTLTYLNGQTFSGTNVSGVPLTIRFNLAEPVERQPQFNYLFDFGLTPNNAGSGNSADNLIISENPAAYAFTVGDSTYSLALLGFSQDSGTTYTRNMEVPEDTAVSSTLFAQFKLVSMGEPDSQPKDIPEPTTILGLVVLLSSSFLLPRKHRP